MSILVRNVSKRFGDFVALDDVSLDVESGSLTALLGPSGSRQVDPPAHHRRPRDGRTPARSILGGEDATALAPQKRNVGFVFQHYAAFKHMTVRDNVAFGLKVRKRPKAEIANRVDELLEPRPARRASAHRYPAQLSGGQRQRMGARPRARGRAAGAAARRAVRRPRRARSRGAARRGCAGCTTRCT